MVLKFQFWLITACSRDEGRDKGKDKGEDEGKDKGKGKAPAESSYVYSPPAGRRGIPYLPDTNPENPGYLDAYVQEQMDKKCLDLNLQSIGTYHKDHTTTYDPSLMAAWDQEQIDAMYSNPMGTYHHGQIDYHHQSETDLQQRSYMDPPDATNIDDLTDIVQFSKPIRTRANQSPRTDLFHDGSHTARPDCSVYQSPDVQEQTSFLDTSKLNTKKLSRNPRRRREHRDKWS